ncbi:MAG: hypothetical protein E7633_09670 [Ruminococcaceae bacterium]|nr:hypothetical protein [Oscillospiraceae bacterium]
MKKFIALLILFTLVFSLLSCEATVEEPKTDSEENLTQNDEEKPSEKPDKNVYFNNIADFKDYISNKENQSKNRLIDANKYIELDSIIPNDEVTRISVDGNNAYSIIAGDITVQIVYPAHKTVREDADEYIKNFPKLINHTPYDSLSIIKDIKDNTEYVWIDLEKYEMIYTRSYNDENNVTEISYCWFVIDNYWLCMRIEDHNSSAQESFVKALNPAYGATDDSVIAMLDKIKALIPKS